MAFSVFQTATGTLKKMTTDAYGDESVDSTLSVNVDPVFGFKRVYSDEDEEITGQSTIITADSLESFFEQTHRNWVLSFNSKDFQVEKATPFYTIGTDNLEHIELVLR